MGELGFKLIKNLILFLFKYSTNHVKCRISVEYLLISKDTNSPPGKVATYAAKANFQTDFVTFFECVYPRCPKIVKIVFVIDIGNHCLVQGIVFVEVNLSPS